MSKIKYAKKFIKFERPLKELSSFDLYYIKKICSYRFTDIYSNQYIYFRKFYTTRPPKFN